MGENPNLLKILGYFSSLSPEPCFPFEILENFWSFCSPLRNGALFINTSSYQAQPGISFFENAAKLVPNPGFNESI